jgi:hypothetical protein
MLLSRLGLATALSSLMAAVITSLPKKFLWGGFIQQSNYFMEQREKYFI